METITYANTENFQKEVVESKIPVLIDFYADWCMPCKMMAPIFEKLSAEYKDKLKFVKVNVDQDSDLATMFGIQGIPALVFTSKGIEVDRIVGYSPENVLKDKIDQVLKSIK